MARNQVKVTVPQGQWVELTDGDADAITYQCTFGAVRQRKAGASSPAPDANGFDVAAGQGERAMPLEELTGTDKRLWAFGVASPASTVFVDHADAI